MNSAAGTSHRTPVILDDVSLVCTMYNEAATVEEFFRAIAGMTCWPSEIIVVDGGSTDGTPEKIQAAFRTELSSASCKLIVDDTCNIRHTPGPIAKGRNIGIRAATGSIIAVTDAGCLVDKHWLEALVRRFRQDPSLQMVGGWYEPVPRGYFETCQVFASFRPLDAVDPATFLPSSRSVAFTKAVWQDVGGYPEIALAAEDTIFDLAVRERTSAIGFAPDAVVYWRLRPNLSTYANLIYRYGFGDGFCRILVGGLLKNILKLVLGFGLLASGVLIHWSFLVALVGYWWLLPFLWRIREAFRWRHIHRYPMISLIKILSDGSYVAGYLAGLLSTSYPRFHRIVDARRP